MTRGDAADLEAALVRIDGQGYPAYRDIRGAWVLPVAGEPCVLHIDHVQGDPFAAPSRVRLTLPPTAAGLPLEECRPGPRATGLASFLARAFAGATGGDTERSRGGGGGGAARGRGRARGPHGGGGGSGGSGRVGMEMPGQQVLDQTAVRVGADGQVEARFTVGLPAAGRRILGGPAADLLLRALPDRAARTLRAAAHDPEVLMLHSRTNEDAEALRAALDPLGLVAFVADGAVLPRRSGVDDRPLEGPEVVPFQSPASLRLTLDRPWAGPIPGMGVPQGVTLIVGGGFHGKSTLLRALERGVYNHRPGDGRECVVTDPAAVKVRAEDGRSVAAVDLIPFIGDLPGGRSTRRFSTGNASGSTSQAASVMEALEAGARAILVDEDTAAMNLMIRDRRMQALVPRTSEPITPYIDRVTDLARDRGVSSVLVLGGSGDYLDVADTVLAMSDYRAHDVTARAREVAEALPTGRQVETPEPFGPTALRIPLGTSVDPSRGRREVSVRVRDADTVLFGEAEIDLSAVEQIVATAQARALGEALLLAREHFMDGRRTVPGILDAVEGVLAERGLDALGRGTDGDLAGFRRFELAAALNRLRGLEMGP